MRATKRSYLTLLATAFLGLVSCESSTAPKPFLECGKVGTISNGDTKNAALSTSDCDLGDGSYVDFYRFRLSSSQTVTITMRSGAFDSFLVLYSAAEALMSFDDDSGGGLDGLDSEIVILLPAGDYVIGANALDAFDTGAYTLSLSH